MSDMAALFMIFAIIAGILAAAVLPARRPALSWGEAMKIFNCRHCKQMTIFGIVQCVHWGNAQ